MQARPRLEAHTGSPTWVWDPEGEGCWLSCPAHPLPSEAESSGVGSWVAMKEVYLPTLWLSCGQKLGRRRLQSPCTGAWQVQM